MKKILKYSRNKSITKGYLLLEDKEWEKANNYFENILDKDPTCAEAYLGKLLVELQMSNIELLSTVGDDLENYVNFQRAIRFGSRQFSNYLMQYLPKIKQKNLTKTAHIHKVIKNIVIILLTVIVIVLVGVLIKCIPILRNEIIYQKACVELKKDNIITAYKYFCSIYNYRDSSEKASNLFDDYKTEVIKISTVGDSIIFGSYKQNDGSNKSPVEWIVLEKDHTKLFLISKYVLMSSCYNDSRLYNLTWADCSLRDWLNENFINTCFSEDERKQILTTTVINEDNIVSGKEGGKDTQDKIFLLSREEVNQYFPNKDNFKCGYTDFAKSNGLRTINFGNDDYCYWWLRSIGRYNLCATYVNGEYIIDNSADNIWDRSIGVRPAMWIQIPE